MKKTVCILLTFAILFAFAACSKNKGEPYVEPPTEILSFEDGETVVYEVVTDAAGEAVTDENGENEVILYDPPVTEKGGYLVTDPEGSTIKQSATTMAPESKTAAVENEEAELDVPANATTGTTAKNETTAVSTAVSEKSTSAGSDILNGADRTTVIETQIETATGKPIEETTTKNPNTPANTTAPDLPEGESGEFGPEISKADAEKLYNILNFENTFDKALCKPDYYEAEKQLSIYIANVENAIAQIKADKTLYQYVGNENLNLWIGYLNEAKEKYAVFMGIYRGMENSADSEAFHITYGDFQDSYRDSLKIYYSMLTSAQAIMYS